MKEYSLNIQKKGIVLFPYAEIRGYKSGVNVANQNNRRDIYLKNCCVACISTKSCNSKNTDVALVTNIDVPEEYKQLLEKHDILIIKEEFDKFIFSENYSWALAFYKLCAIHSIVREFNYFYYAYLDSDVYVQSSFDNIWSECDDNIMLYDINHGLQIPHYNQFLDEVKRYTEKTQPIVHYGGEFFAANRDNALLFSADCLNVFNDMRDKEFITNHGDEFIISIVASRLRHLVKNAGAYVFRFWTGEFRLISTCYKNNEITVIHVPDEKEDGMIKLFKKIKSGRYYDKTNVYNILHLRHRSFIVALRVLRTKVFRGKKHGNKKKN